MSKVTPITIRLELQAGAPLVKFHFTDLHEVNTKVLKKKKAMAEGKKHKKAVARIKIESDALPPVAVNKEAVDSLKELPTQSRCLGNRKYAEMVVQTFTKEQQATTNGEECVTADSQDKLVTMEAASNTKLSKGNGEEHDLEKIVFFSGNPFVEKTSGILHFYKQKDPNCAAKDDCTMLCMLGIPSVLTCRELLRFIAPSSQYITAMKVIRDSTPNQYMVIFKFRCPDSTVHFYDEFNGAPYNAVEPERCSLVFVEKLELVREEAGGSLPIENMTELPTCAVCLERMDDGVLTILCNHTFHAECLEQWTDTTCPVCRHSQTPEVVANQMCSVCGKTTDLWICLICGNIGCGRYAEAHAYRHFEATSHTFTLEIGGERVWDYAGDNYVHRLIQSSTDGKMVEYRRNGISESGGSPDEKLETIQVEYTCLLASQLEYQRNFYESKMNEQERLFSTLEKHNQAQVEELERQVASTLEECEKLKKTLATCTQQQQALEKKQQAIQNKLNKALAELGEEQAVNKLLRSDQEKWSAKVAGLEAENASLQEKFTATVNDLNEQIRDLMMHFEAGNKIQNALEKNEITKKEVAEGTVILAEPQRTPNRNRRRAKK